MQRSQHRFSRIPKRDSLSNIEDERGTLEEAGAASFEGRVTAAAAFRA
jgi:hypothetical protein